MLSISPEENTYRFRIFSQNLEAIYEHNSKLGRSYDKGVNQFTAYTQEEFEQNYLTNLPSRPVA